MAFNFPDGLNALELCRNGKSKEDELGRNDSVNNEMTMNSKLLVEYRRIEKIIRIVSNLESSLFGHLLYPAFPTPVSNNANAL